MEYQLVVGVDAINFQAKVGWRVAHVVVPPSPTIPASSLRAEEPHLIQVLMEREVMFRGGP